MYVIEQAPLQATAIPGVTHATWAGHADGLQQLSVWHQTMAPGFATPPHTHDCDEIVLCQGGRGELHIDGQVHPFGPDQTVIVPRGRAHQIVSTGSAPLEVLAVLAATPAPITGSDGQPLAVPWRT